MNAMDASWMFKALIETADELAKTKAGPLCSVRPAWCAASTCWFQSMAGGGESNTSSIGGMENDRITA